MLSCKSFHPENPDSDNNYEYPSLKSMNDKFSNQFYHNYNNFIIISCAKQKIWDKTLSTEPIPAKDAYISAYFRLCRAFAEKYGTGWAIFSAKYGIISPDFIIHENYDASFKTNSFLSTEIKLDRQLVDMEIEKYDSVIFLGGQSYYKKLESVCRRLNLPLQNPLAHLFIGQRMRLLKNALEV